MRNDLGKKFACSLLIFMLVLALLGCGSYMLLYFITLPPLNMCIFLVLTFVITFLLVTIFWEGV